MGGQQGRQRGRFRGYLSGAKTHPGCEFLTIFWSIRCTLACSRNQCCSPVLLLLLVEMFFDTHFLWLLSWLLTNWGSLSVLPWLPSVSEMQALRSSGQTLHPLYLTISSPTCTQPQGLLRQRVTGEKSFHFKSLCFCFPGQTQEISLSAELGGWYATLFSGGVKTIVLTVLCFGWVQFNPYFPVALTKKTALQTQIALADLSKRPRGGWAMTAAVTPRSNPIPWAKSEIMQRQGT